MKHFLLNRQICSKSETSQIDILDEDNRLMAQIIVSTEGRTLSMAVRSREGNLSVYPDTRNSIIVRTGGE